MSSTFNQTASVSGISKLRDTRAAGKTITRNLQAELTSPVKVWESQ